MAKPIAVQSFQSDIFAPAEQFAAWRECIAPMFETKAPITAAPSPFRAEYEAYLIGPLVLGGTAFDAHDYWRDAAKIRSDGLNHYHVNLHLSGGFMIDAGGRNFAAGPGDITLLDFSRPLAARSLRSELIVIAVPRDLLDSALPSSDHHGLVLHRESSLGGLLADYMRSLAARLPSVTEAEAGDVATATAAIVAACFRPPSANVGDARTVILDALIDRIRRYIDENLRDDLNAETLCRQFSLSRATLYRAFEPFGGVTSYISKQRLSRAFTTLMNPTERHRRISEIGHEWGFDDEAHFSRAFRRAFGFSPRDVQSSMMAASIDGGDGSNKKEIERFLSVLRRL